MTTATAAKPTALDATQIDAMRQQWRQVAQARQEAGQWTNDDEQEIGAAIRAAIDSADAPRVALWAGWVSGLFAEITALRALYAGLGGRIKAQAMQQRVAREKKAKGKA